jgi:hypothetical protein
MVDLTKQRHIPDPALVVSTGHNPSRAWEVDAAGAWYDTGPSTRAPTKGQDALDEAFAKDYAQWRTIGQADATKQLNALGGAKERLKDEQLTGPWIGMAPDRLLNFLNPDAVDIRDTVQEVAQRSLREVLGAQFAEKEGEKLIARAYNQALPEKINRRRVGALLKQIQSAAEQKESAARYFEANGTLKGWEGKLWSMDDFNPEAGDDEDAPPPPPPGTPETPPAADGTVPPAPGAERPARGEIEFGADQRAQAVKDAQARAAEYQGRIDRGDTIKELNDWVKSFGGGAIPAEDVRTILKARDKKVRVGVQMPTEDELLRPEEKARVEGIVNPADGSGTAGTAFGAGASQSIPFINKGIAAADALGGALSGEGSGSFGERYDRERLMQEALFKELQATNPGMFTAGEIGGAFTIPTGVPGAAAKGGKVAFDAARLAGETRAAALAAAKGAGWRSGALRTAGEGAAYGASLGASESENFESVIPNALTGAALGAAPVAVAGVGRAAAGTKAGRAVADWVGSKVGPGARAAGAGVDQVDRDAARAAQDLGIRVPKYVVGGPEALTKGSALYQKGEASLHAATRQMLDDSEAALAKIARDTGGKPLNAVSMGEAATQGGLAVSKSGKNRIGKIYTAARDGAEGVDIPARATLTALDQIAQSESKAIGGTAIGAKFNEMAKQLIEEQGGKLTVDGARKTRTTLRDGLMKELGMTKKDATRLTTHVMGALTEDMEAGLKAAGKENVFKLFQKADSQWRELMELEDKVLEPIIGKEGDKYGDDVAKALISHAQGPGGGVRLGKFLNSIPEERANDIRASLLERMMLANKGEQGAEGTTASLDKFLSMFNDIPARNQIFGKETNEALTKLAQVAEAYKRVTKKTKGSQTAGLVAQLAGKGVPAAIGAAAGTGVGSASGGLPGGGVGGVIGAIVLPLLSRGKSWNAARLLASPKFARKLAATPTNAKGAAEFWSRPWVAGLAKAEPEIGNEILGFREAVLSELSGEPPSVEAPQ